ncbi:MAG TPA: tetratricopeptide repeat protein, partial [Burkholderiales bacterium]
VSAPAQPQSEKPASAADAAKLDMLKLATELATPVRARPAPAKPRARTTAEPRKPARAGIDASTLAALKAQAPLEPAPGQIDRRASGTAHERAAAEFRRAVGLVNQGRVAEGLDGLRAALKIDPGYDEVRQTLVALLIEAKQMDEAAAVLRAGLALEPSNTKFAVVLARVMVEHNDVAGALALLRQHAAAGESSPDYHAFAAALYQRLERHGDAVAEYQAALKLAPNAGVWWVGLGISQQALNRPKDAVLAFQRAKDSGNLAPELAAFTDKRLKLLQ